MNTSKSIDFLKMYIKHLASNKDYRFIIENLCDFLNDKSKVFLKTKKGVSLLKVANTENNSTLTLEAYPNIFEIENANMSVVLGNEKNKSVIDFILYQENQIKYLINRLTFFNKGIVNEDIIEVYKNGDLIYQLSYFKAKKDAIREVIIKGDELIVRTATKDQNDYLKYIKNNGKFSPILSNKKEFSNSKNNIFNDTYNELSM